MWVRPFELYNVTVYLKKGRFLRGLCMCYRYQSFILSCIVSIHCFTVQYYTPACHLRTRSSNPIFRLHPKIPSMFPKVRLPALMIWLLCLQIKHLDCPRGEVTSHFHNIALLQARQAGSGSDGIFISCSAHISSLSDGLIACGS